MIYSFFINIESISGRFVSCIRLHLLLQCSSIFDCVARIAIHIHSELCLASTAEVTSTQHICSGSVTIRSSRCINRSHAALLALNSLRCHIIMLKRALLHVLISSWGRIVRLKMLFILISLNLRIKRHSFGLSHMIQFLLIAVHE